MPVVFALVDAVIPVLAPVELALCEWLTVIASAEPPVSSAESNSAFDPSKPTGTLPAPKATQVPNPNNVAGFVEFDAFMYIDPTGCNDLTAA